ncbi:hypothetical protein [Ferruginibacter sp.]|uniref:hypothetical protein n=1 Tax=Ferruginibacter sp. TaxID=1940288 RepID=UPI00265B5150|nr:hypothetical protein [Ferruginibacter sp.]
MIDTSQKEMEGGYQFSKVHVDIILLYIFTYALSSIVLPVVQRAKIPMIILNLAAKAAIDYKSFSAKNDRTKMTGEWLFYYSACPMPEIAYAFKRARIKFHQVTSMLNEGEECWDETGEWIEAAKVANIMAHNRLGVRGNTTPVCWIFILTLHNRLQPSEGILKLLKWINYLH